MLLLSMVAVSDCLELKHGSFLSLRSKTRKNVSNFPKEIFLWSTGKKTVYNADARRVRRLFGWVIGDRNGLSRARRPLNNATSNASGVVSPESL